MKKNYTKNITKIALAILFAMACSVGFGQTKVERWRTDMGGSDRMYKWSDMSLSSDVSNSTITVDPNTKYQEIDGFGWTMTQGSAKVLLDLDQTTRTNLLKDVFSVKNGMGVSLLRIGVGATDLSESLYTYCDGGNLDDFSLFGNPDGDDLIPILQEIVAINPKVTFLATPWTAPKWMKLYWKDGGPTPGQWEGGYLNLDHYDDYADYLMKYIAAMDAEGLTISHLSLQNEPNNEHNAPSMFMSASDQDRLANAIGPKLAASKYSNVQLLGYDHNCDNTEYPIEIAENQYIDGTAFHLYDEQANIGAMKTVYQTSGKDVYFTEQYTGPSSNFWGDFSWHTKKVTVGSLENYSKTAFNWNFATDQNYEPNTRYTSGTNSACINCMGAVTVKGSSSYDKNISYYIIGHMARVAKPGAHRVKLSGVPSGVWAVAFENADGSGGLFIMTDGFWGDMKINIGGKSFSQYYNNGDVFSYTWDGVDCNGELGGGAYLDDCGDCVEGSTGLSPCGAKDCAGVEGGSAYLDDCGKCVGGTTGVDPCDPTAFTVISDWDNIEFSQWTSNVDAEGKEGFIYKTEDPLDNSNYVGQFDRAAVDGDGNAWVRTTIQENGWGGIDMTTEKVLAIDFYALDTFDFKILVMDSKGTHLEWKEYKYTESDKGSWKTFICDWSESTTIGNANEIELKINPDMEVPVTVWMDNMLTAISADKVTIVSVNDIESNIISLINMPNPAESSTTIKYGLRKAGDVSLKVYDILGNEVANLVNEYQTAGTQEVVFSVANLNSGLYYYSLNVNGNVTTKKLQVIK